MPRKKSPINVFLQAYDLKRLITISAFKQQKLHLLGMAAENRKVNAFRIELRP